MKRWHWRSLALLGVMLAVTLIAIPRFTSGTTQRAAAADPPSVQVDMAPDDDPLFQETTPCVSPRSTRNTTPGETYEVAICLVDAVPSSGSGSPAAFNVNVVYNDSLNQCNGTPTINADFPSPAFDCTGLGFSPPTCDNDTDTGPGHGVAVFGCFSSTGPFNFPAGSGVAAPLAILSFTAQGVGTDTIGLQQVQVTGSGVGGSEYIDCANLGDDDQNNFNTDECIIATDTKGSGATSTPVPTATVTPGATETALPVCFIGQQTPTPVEGRPTLPPCTPTSAARTSTPTVTATPTTAAAGPGAPTAPPPPPPSSGAGGAVRPPNTGDGSNGASLSLTIAWIIAGAMLVTLAGGAFYLRRHRTRE